MLLNHQLCHTFYTDRLYMASANEAGIIRFADAAMQIRVPLGRWVDIGMVAGGQNEALSANIEYPTRNAQYPWAEALCAAVLA